MSFQDDDYRVAKQMMYFLVRLFLVAAVIGGIWLIVLVARSFAQGPSPTPAPVPTPAPTPMDAEAWLAWMQTQATVEQFWLSEFEMPDGDVRLAERVTQVPGAGCGVVSTRGYIQAPGGWWNQGFVQNEVVAQLRLSPMILFESIAYADSVSAAKVKPAHKFQLKVEKKPAKLKRIKWNKSQEIKWGISAVGK